MVSVSRHFPKTPDSDTDNISHSVRGLNPNKSVSDRKTILNCVNLSSEFKYFELFNSISELKFENILVFEYELSV